MAYNNYFPVNYAQPYYSPAPASQNNSGIVWVQGEAAAKSYLVAPNCSVVLWDSEQPIVYAKSADGNGVPNIKKYRLVEEQAETAQNALFSRQADNVPREEFNALSERVDALREEIDKLTSKKSKKEAET